MTQDCTQDSIFVCRTPYHIFLSSILSCSKDSGDSYLLVEPWFDPDSAQIIINSLRSHNVFNKIIILDSVYSGEKKKNYRDQLSSIEKSINIISKKLPHLSHGNFSGELYTTGEAKQTDQYLINNLVEKSNGTNVHLEDGTDDYFIEHDDNWSLYPWINIKMRPKRTYYNLSHRARLLISHRFLWENITKPEDNPWLDSVAAVFPDHLRSSLRKYPSQELPGPEEWDDKIIQWIRQYVEEVCIKPKQLDIDLLFITPHSSEIASAREESSLMDLIEEVATENRTTVGLKPHPREPFTYNLPESVSVIPKEIPAEVLYTLVTDKIELVIGPDSTALYTAKWISPSSTVVSVSKIMGEQTNLLENMGVKYPSTTSELMNICSSHKSQTDEY